MRAHGVNARGRLGTIAGYAIAPNPGGLFSLAMMGHNTAMIQRSDIIWLGVSAGVTGGLVGGLMLGIGLAMVIDHIYGGFVLIIPGAPASGLIGWILSRRLAAQLEQ
jgi:hypothetical protein